MARLHLSILLSTSLLLASGCKADNASTANAGSVPSRGGSDQVWAPEKLTSVPTAYIRDGKLYFGNDLYGRDGALVKAIGEGAMPAATTVKAVEALRRIAAA